jgi:hypothetical protein
MLLQQYTELERNLKASKPCTPKSSPSSIMLMNKEDTLSLHNANKDVTMKVASTSNKPPEEMHLQGNSKHKSYATQSKARDTYADARETMIRNDTTTLPSGHASEMFDTIGTTSEAASSLFGSPHLSASSSPVMPCLPHDSMEKTTSIDLTYPFEKGKLEEGANQRQVKSPTLNKRFPTPKMPSKPPSINRMDNVVEGSSQSLKRQNNITKNEAPVIRKSIQRYSLRSSIQNSNEQKNELVTKKKSVLEKSIPVTKCKESATKSFLTKRTSLSTHSSITEQSTLPTDIFPKRKFLVKEQSLPNFKSRQTIKESPEKRNSSIGRKSLLGATNHTTEASLPLSNNKSILEPKHVESLESFFMKQLKPNDKDTQEDRTPSQATPTGVAPSTLSSALLTSSLETPSSLDNSFALSGKMEFDDSQSKRLMSKQQSTELEKDMTPVAHINRKQPQIVSSQKKITHNSSFSGLRVNALKSSKNISNFF